MAQESCNLDKDEGEILKPTSPKPNPSLLFLKPCQGSPVPRADVAKQPAESSWPSKKLEIKSRPSDRCTSCRRRVGLTGFRCRCGDLFCPRHRYSETHDCSFDYKVVGREQISKANPLVRPAKIIKI